MRVSACLIRDELDDRITVCREGLGYEEPVYSALRIYQGDACMTSEYVYLITEESLTGNPEIESGSCLIITGGCKTVPDWAKHTDCTILVMKDCTLETALNCMIEIFDRYNRWAETLQDCINNHGAVQDMIDASEDIFKNPLFLCDQDYRYLAMTRSGGDRGNTDEMINQEVMCSFRFEPEFQKLWNSSSAFLYTSQFLPYRNLSYRVRCEGNITLGLNLQESLQTFRRSDNSLLECLGKYICMYYNQNYWLLCQNHEEKDSVFKDILEGAPVEAGRLYRVLHSLNWKSDQDYRIYCLEITEQEKNYRFVQIQCHQIETVFQFAFAWEYKSHIVVIVNDTLLGNSDRQEDAALRIFIRENYMKTGAGRLAEGIRAIRNSYLQAVSALEAGKRKHPSRWYYEFSEYCLAYMLYHCIGDLPPEALVPKGLLQMREYDRQNKTSYLLTLETYYHEKCNVSKVADVLYIHRTTCLERLRRIKQFLKMELDDPQNRIYLILSVEILKDRTDEEQLQTP